MVNESASAEARKSRTGLVAIVGICALLLVVLAALVGRAYVNRQRMSIVLYAYSTSGDILEPADELARWPPPSLETPRDEALRQVDEQVSKWSTLLGELRIKDAPPQCRSYAKALEAYLESERSRMEHLYSYLLGGGVEEKSAWMDSITESYMLRQLVSREGLAVLKWPFPSWWPW